MANKKTAPKKTIPAATVATPAPAPIAAPAPVSVMSQIEMTQAQVLALRDQHVAATEGEPDAAKRKESMRWAFACLRRWEALEELKKTFLREADIRAFAQGKLDELFARRKELAAVVAVPIQPEKTPVEP